MDVLNKEHEVVVEAVMVWVTKETCGIQRAFQRVARDLFSLSERDVRVRMHKYGCISMDAEVWTHKYGCRSKDEEVRMQKHGHRSMDAEVWMLLELFMKRGDGGQVHTCADIVLDAQAVEGGALVDSIWTEKEEQLL